MEAHMAFGNFDNIVMVDGDGFGPPANGGIKNVKFNTIAYTNTTAKNLFTIPRGSEIVGWTVVVKTAFDDTGTDLLDIGITGTLEKFAVDLDVSSIATLNETTAGFVEAQMYTEMADDTTVTGVYTGQNGNSAHGSAVVAVFYIVR
jgi:hypothetical protein